MPTADEMRDQRVTFLGAVYDAAGGDTTARIAYAGIAEAMDLSDLHTQRAIEWLKGQGWLDTPVLGPFVAITPEGADQVEIMRSPPTQTIEVPFIGKTPDAVLVGLIEPEEAEALGKQAERLRSELDRLEDGLVDIDRDTFRELKALADALNVLLKGGRPRRGLVGWLARSTRIAGEALVAKAAVEVGADAVGSIPDVLDHLGDLAKAVGGS